MRATFRLWLGGVLLAALAAAVTVAPQAALAQGEPTADAKDAARVHYTKGKELYEKGTFDEALKEFQLAYDAKPHPTVLKSVAECQVQVGDITAAIETFEKYLADPASTKKEVVETRLAEVKAMLGTVDITTEPAGAGIVLDGDTTGKTTPATLDVGPGTHEVVLNVDGFEPLAKQVKVKTGEQAELKVNFDEEGIPAAPPLDADPLADPFAEGEEGGVDDEGEGDGPPAAFWVCAAVAGVGLVSGTVFGTMALGDEEDYKNNPEDDIKESGERNAIIADVSFGVAAAAAIVGAVILFTAGGDDEEAEVSAEAKSKWNVSPVAGGNTIGVSTSVTF
ncbi:MAG: PEGA domain-containing protein [Deltaproteobacteria bacterium]|nr:PEGA domain-containing protein [Deltaproteobacteria bacterium]